MSDSHSCCGHYRNMRFHDTKHCTCFCHEHYRPKTHFHHSHSSSNHHCNHYQHRSCCCCYGFKPLTPVKPKHHDYKPCHTRCHHDPHDHHYCSHCSGHFFDRHLCSRDFRLRLGGLQGGLAFRFRQLLDCDVKLKVDCEGDEREIKGRVCFVGTNFVEIHSKPQGKSSGPCRKGKRRAKRRKHRYRIIPFDKICSIEMLEK